MQQNYSLLQSKVIRKYNHDIEEYYLQCEIRKEVLCEIKQFEPFQLFEQLKDKNYEGSLHVGVLFDFLVKNEILVSLNELLSFFKFIKTKNSDKLLYSEFLSIILPNKKQKLRQKVLVRQSNNSDQSCNNNNLSIKESDTTTIRKDKKKAVCNIGFALSQVFDQEIRLFRLVEIMRQKMFENGQAASNDLNLIQTFNTIDKEKKGSITRNDVLRFLNKFVKNAQFSIDDIYNLFRRLNIDEEEQKISYLQFMNVILPSSDQFITGAKIEDLGIVFRSAGKESNYKNVRQSQKQRDISASDVKQRQSLIVDIDSKPYTTFNSIGKIQTTASTQKKQQQSTQGRNTLFNVKTAITPSKIQSQKKESTSKEKQTTNYSLRYNEVRDLKTQLSKSFEKKGSGQQESKYKLTRFKKQMKPMNAGEQKNQNFKQDKTPRKQSINQTRNSVLSSLYTNTIQSPTKQSILSKSQESFISTPVKASSSKSQVFSKSSSKRANQENQSSGDDKFDQDEYDMFHKMRRGYISPMKGKEEDYFIDILKELLKLETSLEEIKEELIMYCNDFNPVQAYRIFVSNPDKAKNINIYNLREAFDLMKVPLTNHESELMLKRLDSNRDGQLTYTDICDIFRPRNKALAKDFDQRMPFELQISQRLSEGATLYIKKLFVTLVKTENHIEHLKIQLIKRPKFDLEQAFQVLNLEGFERVSQEDLQNILRIHGLITFPRELNPLFTRFDKDKDGLINFHDFKHEITPFNMKRII